MDNVIKTRFWQDAWVDREGTFQNATTAQVSIEWANRTVCEFVTIERSQNW